MTSFMVGVLTSPIFNFFEREISAKLGIVDMIYFFFYIDPLD